MMYCRATLVGALTLGMGLGSARVALADEWVLGGLGGIPWAQVAKSTAQIDSQTSPTAIRLTRVSGRRQMVMTEGDP